MLINTTNSAGASGGQCTGERTCVGRFGLCSQLCHTLSHVTFCKLLPVCLLCLPGLSNCVHLASTECRLPGSVCTIPLCAYSLPLQGYRSASFWLWAYSYPGYWQACPEKWMFRFSVFFTSSAFVWCFVFHVPNFTYIPFLLLHPAFTYLGLHLCPSASSPPPAREDSLFSWPSNLTLIPS